MASSPEHLPDPGDKIRWLSRDRTQAEPAISPSADVLPRASRLAALRDRWPLFAIIALVVIVAAVVAMRAMTGGAPTNAQHAATLPLVSVVAPHLNAVTSTVAFTGTIAARYDVAMGVEGEGGRVAVVHVEEGDRVKRGQVLATLDTSIVRPQVDRLAASLEEARANAELADAEYRRAQAVAGSGALSAEEIERRRAAAVTAAAQVNVAAAQLAEARARLDRTALRAPADGTVLTRSAEVGEFPMPGGEPLFRLSRGDDVEVRAQVAEQDLPRLAIGQKVIVRLTGIAEGFEGRVRVVGPVIDPQTRLGWIRVELEPHPLLRPGAFARGEVNVGEARRPVLPQTAVLSDANGNYVMVVGSGDKVVKRPVRVVDTNGRGVVIGDGLTGDERVVATAGAFLREGEQVKVANSDTSASAP